MPICPIRNWTKSRERIYSLDDPIHTSPSPSPNRYPVRMWLDRDVRRGMQHTQNYLSYIYTLLIRGSHLAYAASYSNLRQKSFAGCTFQRYLSFIITFSRFMIERRMRKLVRRTKYNVQRTLHTKNNNIKNQTLSNEQSNARRSDISSNEGN